MRHSEVRERLSPYLEGELEAEERARLDRHLAGCAACAAECREQEETIRLLRTLPEPEPPARFAEAVMSRVKAGAADAPGRVYTARRLGLALAAGIAGLTVLATFTTLERSGRPAPSGPAEAAASAGAPLALDPGPLRDTSGVVGPPFFSGEAPVLQDSTTPAGRSGLVAGADRGRSSLGDAELDALLADPDAFLDGLEAMDAAQREEILGGIARSAARRGDAPELARALGATPHPLAPAAASRLLPTQ